MRSEMAVVGHADLPRDVCDWQAGGAQENFCAFNSSVNDVLVGGVAGRGLEAAREMKRAACRDLRKNIERQRVSKIRLDVVERSLEPQALQARVVPIESRRMNSGVVSQNMDCQDVR